jgi:hypothetical protein
MTFFYTSKQLKVIIDYNCKNRVDGSNKRFNEKISIRDVVLTLERNDYKCFYCNDFLKPKEWQLDHFYAKAIGGKNTLDNLCPTCKWCNIMKHSLDGNAFILKCRKIAEKNFFIRNQIEYHDTNQHHINKF